MAAPKNQAQAKSTVAPAAAPDQAEKQRAVQGLEIAVSAVPGLERRCRAGRCFGAEPTVIPVAELDRDTLDAFVADPMLVVAEHKPSEAAE